jgi:hypothetical protein
MKDQDVLPNCGDRGGNEKKRKYEGSSVSPHSDLTVASRRLVSKLRGGDEARFLDPVDKRCVCQKRGFDRIRSSDDSS